MEQKCSNLPSHVWLSRFWARYSTLPEPFKEVFFSLVKSIAEQERAEREKNCHYKAQAGDRHG